MKMKYLRDMKKNNKKLLINKTKKYQHQPKIKKKNRNIKIVNKTKRSNKKF